MTDTGNKTASVPVFPRYPKHIRLPIPVRRASQHKQQIGKPVEVGKQFIIYPFAQLEFRYQALGAARNITHSPALRGVAGAAISLLRSIPEMISALFLVIAYGFGPIAGILALAFYGAGYLGKVYGEDMEGLDPRPQEALAAGGATMLAQLRDEVLPLMEQAGQRKPFTNLAL